MNKPVKLPEIRQGAFTKARENLGLSTKDLSGMACLSVRQIEQIENGETSSFYGAQVKFTAAKKVAGLLNLNQDEAFDFGEAPPLVKELEKIEEVQVEVKQVSPEKLVKTEKIKEAATTKAKKEATPSFKPSSIDYRSKSNSNSQTNPKKKLFILLGIAAALVFSIVNLRPLFFPEAPKEEIIVVEAVPEVAPATPTEALDAKPAAAAVVVPTPELATSISTECPAADSAVVNYRPDAPKKAGDMVYLQSKTAQTVCVIDATGKTQNKTLEPGVGASIYGKPPFKVLTGGMNQVDLYYQGAKVRLSAASAKTIILEPAELSQPVAPSTDSQLR